MEEISIRLRRARRHFSVIGFAFAALLVVALVVQIGMISLPDLLGWGDAVNQSSWWDWICASAPMYLFAFPACCLILRFLPGKAPEPHVLSKKQFFTLLPICICLMYIGNLVGTVLSMVLSWGTAVNALDSYAMDQHPMKILVMVILAPTLEEWICRKLLVDRTVRYGEKLSVLMSGLIFGLLHGNLFQFFYAFGLGCLFAYVYIRTGKVGYTMILHAIINFLGAVVAPAVLALLPADTLSALGTDSITARELLTVLAKAMVVVVYSMTLAGVAVFGLVLLLLRRRHLLWKETEQQLPGKPALKKALLNPGMIVYILICLIMIVLALFNI